jgi:MGT family glycosyltransferase
MKRQHIAIFTLSGIAHVYPILGVCSELANRGYRVSYAAVRSDAARISQAGAEVITFQTPENRGVPSVRYPGFDDPAYWPLVAATFFPWRLKLAEQILIETESFYMQNPPDLILYDRCSYVGRILANRFGCPAVQLWPTFAHHNTVIRENGVCFNPKSMVEFSNQLDSFLSAHGVEGTNGLWHSERLNIYFVPREFQFEADTFDERFCFVGLSLNRAPSGTWNPTCRSKKVILISQSSASVDSCNYLRSCMDAFSRSNYHVVLSVNEWSKNNLIRDLPPNMEINKDKYNFDLMTNVALTVCQGGMGITLDSLYCGVPVLSIPLTPYHGEVAYRVAELGLGSYLPERDISPDVIRSSVDNILRDSALLDRVKVARQVFRANGGSNMAADRIEEHLSSCGATQVG